MGPFFFRSPDRPDLDYTERQFLIISELVPLQEVSKTELTRIIKKARARGDQDICDYVEELLSLKDPPLNTLKMYTIEEAKAILQELTPWTIRWDTPCKY